tara:strand:- start:132 stop:332 length:201 start_codon:yes stop_codon:yes gene_type:complete
MLLAIKNETKESHKKSLFPILYVVSTYRKILPEIIITFLNILVFIPPMNTPSNQKAIVPNIKIRYK